jgi:DHA1 family multidrug resistance protein-like MFS transporter
MNFVRETPLGDLLRAIGFQSQLLFPEEVDGFLPEHNGSPSSFEKADIEMQVSHSKDSHSSDDELSPKATKADEGPDVILVEWYGADDTANPQNWSPAKKAWVTLVIWYVHTRYWGLPHLTLF